MPELGSPRGGGEPKRQVGSGLRRKLDESSGFVEHGDLIHRVVDRQKRNKRFTMLQPDVPRSAAGLSQHSE
jgi:hypothetical protein